MASPATQPTLHVVQITNGYAGIWTNGSIVTALGVRDAACKLGPEWWCARAAFLRACSLDVLSCNPCAVILSWDGFPCCGWVGRRCNSFSPMASLPWPTFDLNSWENHPTSTCFHHRNLNSLLLKLIPKHQLNYLFLTIPISSGLPGFCQIMTTPPFQIMTTPL
jgi:hypothetical protein